MIDEDLPFTLETDASDNAISAKFKGVRKGGQLVWVNPPLSLIFYENFITCAKEINCFRILFAC